MLNTPCTTVGVNLDLRSLTLMHAWRHVFDCCSAGAMRATTASYAACTGHEAFS